MRIEVATEQDALKKKHGGGPHSRTPAKPRQYVFADQRLNLK